MKGRLFALVVVLLGALAATGATSAATYTPTDCGKGKLVVNVTFQVTNDYDSSRAGTSWANDTIDRHVQVFDLGGGMYCATDNDRGSFVTMAGPSPENTGTVTDGIKGTINGGYATTVFSGTLSSSPAYKTHGNLGSFDLACITYDNCPGEHPSFLSYFDGSPSWDYADWGWSYHTARNGDWTDAATGDSGDITG